MTDQAEPQPAPPAATPDPLADWIRQRITASWSGATSVLEQNGNVHQDAAEIAGAIIGVGVEICYAIHQLAGTPTPPSSNGDGTP